MVAPTSCYTKQPYKPEFDVLQKGLEFYMQVWYNTTALQGSYIGNTTASQAVKAGSTPVPCSIVRRCGGIGRHKGLKIPRSKIRTGSIPVSGTK